MTVICRGEYNPLGHDPVEMEKSGKAHRCPECLVAVEVTDTTESRTEEQ